MINLRRSPQEELFAAIHKEHYNKVLFFARQYLHDYEEAREVAQDVFMRLWEIMPQVNPELNVCSLLLTMTKNRCLNILRHRNYKARYADDTLLKAQNMLDQNALSDETFDKLLATEISQLVDDAMSDMTPAIKETYLLSRRENMTNNAIADRLDISVKSVEYRMKRALADLRKKLIDYIPVIIFYILTTFCLW